MRQHVQVRRLAAIGVFVLWSCSGDDTGAEPVTSSKAAAGADFRSTAADVVPTPEVLSKRGRFFAWVPKDAILVAHVPSIDRTKSALKQSAVAGVFKELDFGQAAAEVKQIFDAAIEELDDQLGADMDFNSLVSCFGGNAVLAVTEINPMLLMSQSSMPFSVVLYTELDGGAPLVKQTLRRLAEEAGGSHHFDTTGSNQDKIVFESREFHTQVIVDEEILAISVTPPMASQNLEQWMSLATEDSFLAAEVMRGLPADLSASLFEVLLNLEPAWDMVRTLAPPEAQRVVDSLGVEHIKGAGLVAQIDGENFKESMVLYSPGQKDFLSRILGGASLDPDFVQWVPGDVHEGGVFAFSLARAFEEVRNALPAEFQTGMDQGVRQLEMMSNVNLRADILENFGPNFAYGMKGSAMLASAGQFFEMVVAIEVQDEKKTHNLIDMLLNATGMAATRRTQTAAGREFYTLDLPVSQLGGSVAFELCYAIQDDALVVGSSPSAIRKAMLASQTRGRSAPEELGEALEQMPTQTFSASYSDVSAQLETLRALVAEVAAIIPGIPSVSLPTAAELETLTEPLADTIAMTRMDPRGIFVETSSSVGLGMGGSAVAALGVGSSIAIPNLMQARRSASESKAIANLRMIAVAQEQFKASGVVDLDHDNIGEYGYLAELSGALAPRGGTKPLQIPLLSPPFQDIEQGVVGVSGYYFRVDLPGTNGEPLSEAPSGGAFGQIPANSTEQGWVAYCWPMELGNSGERVFVIDETGNVFASNNDGPNQGYSGLTRMPRGDASFIQENSNRERGPRSVRRGADGALWLREEL